MPECFSKYRWLKSYFCTCFGKQTHRPFESISSNIVCCSSSLKVSSSFPTEAGVGRAMPTVQKNSSTPAFEDPLTQPHDSMTNTNTTWTNPSLTLSSFFSQTLQLEERKEFYRKLHARASTTDSIFISLTPLDVLLRQLDDLERLNARRFLPLHGVPFVVKDNIDSPPLSTTAACSAFSYIPSDPAFVVKELTDAGALVLGKSNMDQFACGLVGTRSPYGTPENACNARYVPGGSSSGSAVAVATGLCVFALSTDTAGSGRVPAALNGIVGVKPTKGLISTTGVVPAAESLDCVGILASTVADSAFVLHVAAEHFDDTNLLARKPPPEKSLSALRDVFQAPGAFKFGIPGGEELTFWGDDVSERSFAASIKVVEAVGGECVTINYAIFREAASLLYGGPFVAERFAAHGESIKRIKDSQPGDLDPVVSKIILDSESHPAWKLFEAQKRMSAYIRQAKNDVWAEVQVLVLPSLPRPVTLEEVSNDPVHLNNMLGTYTNFVNLMDYCAVAVPAPPVDGEEMPRGVTFVARAFEERLLLALAQEFESRVRGAGSI